MSIATIQPPHFRPPAGHYSPAVVHRGLVYVSGQLPIDPATGAHCPGPVEAQAEQVMRNLAEVLAAAGSGLDRVLKVTIYVADVVHWGAVNAVYARWMGSHRPARAIVPTGPLHHGFLLELEAVAATRS